MVVRIITSLCEESFVHGSTVSNHDRNYTALLLAFSVYRLDFACDNEQILTPCLFNRVTFWASRFMVMQTFCYNI